MTTPKHAVVAAVVALLMIGPRPARAQSGTGSIQGITRTDAGPVEGVSVSVIGTPLGALTRSDGRFTIAGVPAGPHVLRISRIGYGRRDQQVTVIAGQAVTV